MHQSVSRSGEYGSTNGGPSKSVQAPPAVKDYWEGHTLGLQYVKAKDLTISSAEFFEHIGT